MIHPYLEERIGRIIDAYAARSPGYELKITCGHRTLAAQQAAYREGRSKLDGIRRWSLHQLYPALAVDVAVLGPGGVIWDFSRYQLYGELARAEGLTWGGDWPELRDGPHAEVAPRERVRLLQTALAARGYDCGPADGLDGPRTQAALRAAEADLRRSLPGLPTTIRPHWVQPDLWAWLHRPAEAGIGVTTGLRAAI